MSLGINASSAHSSAWNSTQSYSDIFGPTKRHVVEKILFQTLMPSDMGQFVHERVPKVVEPVVT